MQTKSNEIILTQQEFDNIPVWIVSDTPFAIPYYWHNSLCHLMCVKGDFRRDIIKHSISVETHSH